MAVPTADNFTTRVHSWDHMTLELAKFPEPPIPKLL
jgi:hypothetical protein